MKKFIFFSVATMVIATSPSIAEIYESPTSYYIVKEDNRAADQAIAIALTNTLKKDWLSKGYENLTFSVKERTVEIKGIVNNEEDRIAVEDSIRKIAGVRDVNNHLFFSHLATTRDAKNLPLQDRYATNRVTQEKALLLNSPSRH